MAAFKACSSADELNKKLLSDIFYNDECAKDLNLVEHWKVDTQDGGEYIEKHGKEIMKLALKAYVDLQHKLRFCMLVNDRMHTPFGLTVASKDDHNTLSALTNADSLSAEDVADAVKKRVLTSSCLSYFEGAKGPELSRKRKKT